MDDRKLKKFLIRTFVVVILIIIIMWILYRNQYQFIFWPTKLDKNYEFQFPDYENNFEELWFDMPDGTKLNGLLFRRITDEGLPYRIPVTANERKLIFYMHGNAENLQTWGRIAPLYTYYDHDIFILDYRGYGKSEGKITSQTQLFDDVSNVYEYFLKTYKESNITVVGYSIGTAVASYVAQKYNPQALILNAPYYSLTRLIRETYSFIPNFLVSFKLETYKYIQECKCPIYIFHGNNDTLIPLQHSLDLKEFFKTGDQLFILNGVEHDNINQSEEYNNLLGNILLNF